MKILNGITLCMLIALTPGADAQVFAGYDEFCGLPIVIGETPQDAVATRDSSGNPIILVDPKTMAGLTYPRRFTIAHECGHHKLAHLSPNEMFQRAHMQATRRQELEADCFAARVLGAAQDKAELVATITYTAAQGFLDKGPYPTGFERASRIAQCARVAIESSVQIAYARDPTKTLSPNRYVSQEERAKLLLQARVKRFLEDSVVSESPDSDRQSSDKDFDWRQVVAPPKDLCELRFHSLDFPDTIEIMDFSEPFFLGRGIFYSYEPSTRFRKIFLKRNAADTKYRHMVEKFTPNPQTEYKESYLYPTLVMSTKPPLYWATEKISGEGRVDGDKFASSLSFSFTSERERESFAEILQELSNVCKKK